MTAPARRTTEPAPDATERPRSSAADMLEQRRRKVSMAIADAEAGYDLALLTELDFAERLALRTTRQDRIRRIIDTQLLVNVHYGSPQGGKLPILWNTGAEVLRDLFRYSARALERSVTETPDYVGATVVVGIYGPTGLLLTTRLGHCNARESWVRDLDGPPAAGAPPLDARERLHVCYVRAEMRASVLATREACGATAHFAYPEELATALRLLDRPAGDMPLTETEVKALRWDAALLGIRTTPLWRALLREALGAAVAQDIATPTQAQGAKIAALLDARRQAKAGATTRSAGTPARSAS